MDDLHNPDMMVAESQRVSSGVIKRSRQACASCRQRKIKCSAEQPACSNCRQSRRSCCYEPYPGRYIRDRDSVSKSAAISANAELLNRISTIESVLVKLNPDALQTAIRNTSTITTEHISTSLEAANGEQLQNQNEDRCASIATSDSGIQLASFDNLPPPSITQSLIDVYFSRVNGQPYSFLHEASFRHRMENGTLPRHLLFAVASLAVRFHNHPFFSGRIHEASATYAKHAWSMILMDHIMVLNNITLSVIQTVSILAVVDYTAGRVSSGWLRVGLATRLSQGIDLMTEPPSHLSLAEQNERRSTFWSLYILDRLMSCARSRPPAIADDSFDVQLPSPEGEDTARSDAAGAQTLGPLLSWETQVSRPPRGFVLAILMSWVLGRCIKYVHGRSVSESAPPFDPKSDFVAINSSLMLLESYLDINGSSIMDLIQEACRSEDAARNLQQLGHPLMARALFHLSHCLLNHPFLLRVRLQPFAGKVPRSFSLRSLQLAEDHAKKLTDLLSSASDGGILVESSFYTYCVAVSGAIHIMALSLPQNNDGLGQYNAADYYQRCVDIINSLSHLWPMAKNIEMRLRRFYDMFPSQLGLFDPASLAGPINPLYDELLWSVVDYNTLAGELPKWDVFPSISALPSPSLWDMDGVLPELPHGMNLQGPAFFSDLQPFQPTPRT